ncbi:MAG: GatB/YqeY domain-containing protein [Gemmatimonadota bacterium]
MDVPLKKRLQEDLKEARKAREKLRTLVLSTTLSELRNREIEIGGEADDQETVSVIAKAVKRRNEAAEQMRAGGREELAERETREAEILSRYMPEGLSEDEVREIVRSILSKGPRELGPVMGQLMPRIQGRFDGREANRIVREELAG